MREKPKVVICDCDHLNVDLEKDVFEAAGYDFAWLHCQNEAEVVEQCQGAVVFLNQYAPMNEQVFKGIPTLKMIVRYGVGVDNVNLADAVKYGVQVSNVPDYGTEEVADQALAMMLCLIRKIDFTNRRVKAGIWNYAEAMPIRRDSVSTVGIIGIGRIGSALARRARALGCRIIAYDVYDRTLNLRIPDFVEMVSLNELLASSDVVSVNCSLNEQTQNIMGEREFKLMKPSAYFINVARGGLVDETALDRALSERWIAGAGIDVIKQEPPASDHPLLRHDNLLISPHIAWYSEEAALDLKRKCAEEAVRFMRGERLRYPVNKL